MNNCRSHQSIYTCLSRGSSYDNTLILQGFDSKHMIGGLPRDLRQEFRDLEILDDITTQNYLNQLDKQKVYGNTRNPLIQTYRQHKTVAYTPPFLHKSLL